MDSRSTNDLVDTYLRALSSGDAELAVSLFADDGMVSSPLYGDLPARDFYPSLFADTAESVLTLKKTLVGSPDDAGGTTVAFWFDFGWVLADGTPAPFTVVDVAELDRGGRISRLHIVYDTHPLREAWGRQRRSASADRP